MCVCITHTLHTDVMLNHKRKTLQPSNVSTRVVLSLRILRNTDNSGPKNLQREKLRRYSRNQTERTRASRRSPVCISREYFDTWYRHSLSVIFFISIFVQPHCSHDRSPYTNGFSRDTFRSKRRTTCLKNQTIKRSCRGTERLLPSAESFKTQPRRPCLIISNELISSFPECRAGERFKPSLVKIQSTYSTRIRSVQHCESSTRRTEFSTLPRARTHAHT